MTDGTPEGTVVASGPFFGTGIWEPKRLTWSGDQLFFMADEGQNGLELWTVDLGVTAQPFGTSCAAPVQMLRLSSNDPVLGTTTAVEGAGALPSVPALAGLRASLQAVLGPTATPVGVDVTNGVLWTLGL